MFIQIFPPCQRPNERNFLLGTANNVNKSNFFAVLRNTTPTNSTTNEPAVPDRHRNIGDPDKPRSTLLIVIVVVVLVILLLSIFLIILRFRYIHKKPSTKRGAIYGFGLQNSSDASSSAERYPNTTVSYFGTDSRADSNQKRQEDESVIGNPIYSSNVASLDPSNFAIYVDANDFYQPAAAERFAGQQYQSNEDATVLENPIYSSAIAAPCVSNDSTNAEDDHCTDSNKSFKPESELYSDTLQCQGNHTDMVMEENPIYS